MFPTNIPAPSTPPTSGDQGVCPGMQKVFWRQKCPGTRGVRDNRRPGTVLAVPGHLASSQDTYAVLGRCCPKTANCPGTGAGVPGPPSWDTRCPGTPCVPGYFFRTNIASAHATCEGARRTSHAMLITWICGSRAGMRASTSATGIPDCSTSLKRHEEGGNPFAKLVAPPSRSHRTCHGVCKQRAGSDP